MKKIIAISLTLFVLLNSGCKDFLDVNHDPNNPEESTVQLVFPAAVTQTMSIFGSYGLMLGEIWSQHWTSDANAPGYQGEDSYNVTAGDYNYDIGIWRGIYAGPLMDYEWVRNTAKADSNWTYYLMATVMQCYTYQIMADLWEDIPVHEALQGYAPHYDLGSNVYDTLIARIDDALAKDLSAKSCETPEDDDLIFGGEMSKWVQLANTLKLKIYLREVDARPDVAQQGITDLYASPNFIDEDVKFDWFTDEGGRDNPMYGMEFRGGNMNMRASNTLVSFLDDVDDPRIAFIFQKTKAGKYRGLYQGDFRNYYSDTTDAQEPEFSSPFYVPLMPHYFFTKAQVLLMRAEVAARFPSLETKTAAELYNSAIEADVNRLNSVYSDYINDNDYNLDQLDPEDVQAKYSYPATGTLDEQIEAIIVQKWVCLANINGLEAFFEHNRTGYPKESEVNPGDDNFLSEYVPGEWTVSVTGVLAPPIRYPKRLIFTSTEQSRNPNTPEVKSLNEPLWWDYQKK